MYFPVLHHTCLFLIFFLPSLSYSFGFFFSLLLLKHVPPSTSFLSSSNPLLFPSSFHLSYPPLPLQAGKIPPNSTVGRLLMEMVSRVPKIEGPKFDSMLNATMQASNTFYVYNKLSSLGFRPLFADMYNASGNSV